MIDCGLNKTQLREMAGVSTNVIAKMGKGKNVSMDALIKICKAMQCNIADVVEIVGNYNLMVHFPRETT